MLLFPTLLSVLGVLLLLQTYAGFSSISWKTTEGRVTGSKLHRDTVRNYRRDEPDAYFHYYRLEIEYSFRVDGTEYLANRVAFQDAPDFQTPIRRLEHYPPGKRVKVHYFQLDPNLAVLEPGFAPGLVGAAAILLIIGLSWIYLDIRLYQHARETSRLTVPAQSPKI